MADEEIKLRVRKKKPNCLKLKNKNLHFSSHSNAQLTALKLGTFLNNQQQSNFQYSDIETTDEHGNEFDYGIRDDSDFLRLINEKNKEDSLTQLLLCCNKQEIFDIIFHMNDLPHSPIISSGYKHWFVLNLFHKNINNPTINVSDLNANQLSNYANNITTDPRIVQTFLLNARSCLPKNRTIQIYEQFNIPFLEYDPLFDDYIMNCYSHPSPLFASSSSSSPPSQQTKMRATSFSENHSHQSSSSSESKSGGNNYLSLRKSTQRRFTEMFARPIIPKPEPPTLQFFRSQTMNSINNPFIDPSFDYPVNNILPTNPSSSSSSSSSPSPTWDDVNCSQTDLLLCKVVPSYYYEGSSSPSPSPSPDSNRQLYVIDSDSDSPFFSSYFVGKEYRVYAAGDPHYIFICITKGKHEPNSKIIIFSPDVTHRLMSSMANSKYSTIFKQIIDFFPDFSAINFVIVKNEEVEKNLLCFENTSRFTKYKFGILYCAPHQTDENDMFSNVEESEEYKQFLDFIGEKVRLQNWRKFRGGLDVKGDNTGTHSIFGILQCYEIMFHVSTMLPFYEKDIQQLERKRHLGNDVAIIVYKEGPQLFDASEIHSEFNHIFIVVQKNPDSPTYRVEVCYKNEMIEPPVPLLPCTAFELNDYFRELLYTKLINSERVAMKSKQFASKLLRTRKTLLTNYVLECSSFKHQS